MADNKQSDNNLTSEKVENISFLKQSKSRKFYDLEIEHCLGS